MQRDPSTLANTQYDLAIIGGGAFGAAAARSAALRGLRTVLIERNDFGSGASAECFKMVHGGIRYLQHADIRRARASCRERSAFLRTAPHLVKPLPIAIPTYGHGRRGKPLLRAGMHAYDLLTLDRNRRIADPLRCAKPARFLSRAETLELFPHVDAAALTGAAVFDDGQMHNPARLVFAFVESAIAAGASASNYLEATGFIFERDSVAGVEVIDRLSGEAFAIKARLVLNAAGPWADYMLRDRARFPTSQRGPFSRDAYFIINRPPTSDVALAIPGLSRDEDAVLSRANRHLFMAPWRNKTLVGVWHRLFPQHPDKAHIERSELAQWIDEINTVNPRLALSIDEVTFANCGLVPFGEHADAQSMQFGKESRFVDHRKTHGVGGLVTLIGIRYTMARVDAEHALDMLLEQSELAPPHIKSEFVPLAGGAFDSIESLRARAERERPASVSRASLESLLCNHGAAYRAVLQRIAADASAAATAPGTAVLAAEVQHAVVKEMAVHLSDVVLRRTDLSGHEHPGPAALRFAAHHMAALLRWSPARIEDEISATEAALEQHHATSHLSQPSTLWRVNSGA